MNLILAADEKWAIGKNNDLLCHLPGDLKYFKEQTLGKTVVMGRKTLETLPGKKGLPGRTNIVLTSDPDYVAERALTVHSLEELEEALKDTAEEAIMIIGGAKVYNDFLPKCDVCYITKIYGDFDGDKFFVNLDEDPDFVGKELGPVMEENGIKYQFFKYERKGK